MLLRLEILIFIISLGYILFYIVDFLYLSFSSRFKFKKQIQDLDKKHELKKKSQKKKEEAIEEAKNSETKMKKQERIEALTQRLSVENNEQLREIIKRAQMNISRGYLETARTIVIEGLAMKKQDKELNILLAEIYEREKKYQHAAYIYKDLMDEFVDDIVIMQKLGNSLYLLGDNTGAFEIYSQVHKKNRSNIEVLDILSHLSIDTKDYKAGVKYANLYLKEKPRNAEKLGIKAYCLEKMGRTRESIEAYKRILDVQPYNTEVTERINILEAKSE
ncbi:hypothetical protein LAT59_02935 [Candidatus Gracilibacteria bacterium]|nr:hypothetical protein [Candidatus Gracilibacteria bacterium]